MLINSIRWRPNTFEESRGLLSFVSIVYLAAGPCILTLCVYMDTFLCGQELLSVHVHMHVYLSRLSAELCYCPEPVAVRTSDLYPAEKLVSDWQYTKAMVSDDQRQAVYLTPVP